MANLPADSMEMPNCHNFDFGSSSSDRSVDIMSAISPTNDPPSNNQSDISEEKDQCDPIEKMDPLEGNEQAPTTRRKQVRITFTAKQRASLEEAFLKDNRMKEVQRAELATRLNLPLHKVSVWFQNRRSKEKRQKMPKASRTNPALSAGILQTQAAANANFTPGITGPVAADGYIHQAYAGYYDDYSQPAFPISMRAYAAAMMNQHSMHLLAYPAMYPSAYPPMQLSAYPPPMMPTHPLGMVATTPPNASPAAPSDSFQGSPSPVSELNGCQSPGCESNGENCLCGYLNCDTTDHHQVRFATSDVIQPKSSTPPGLSDLTVPEPLAIATELFQPYKSDNFEL